MADIAPELYEKIKETFQKKYDRETLYGKPLKDIEEALRSRAATFQGADAYAVRVGSMLSDAMKEVLQLDELPGKKLTYDIAKRTIGTSLQDSYRMVSNVAAVVQEEINGRAGIGLKPVRPQMSMADINKIAADAAKAKEQKQLDTALTEPVKTYPRTVVDDTIRANARVHSKAGLDVRVTRIYDGVGVHDRKDECKWCMSRCGENMTYADAMAKGAFQRHPGCGCEILYMVGKSVQRQTDWTKNQWDDIDESEIQRRKRFRITEVRASLITEKVRKGEYSLKLSWQNYNKHLEGHRDYERYAEARKAKGQNPPSVLTISKEEAQRIIANKSGTGIIKTRKDGTPMNQEMISCDKIVGKYFSHGAFHETTKAIIHYGKDGAHLVPHNGSTYD